MNHRRIVRHTLALALLLLAVPACDDDGTDEVDMVGGGDLGDATDPDTTSTSDASAPDSSGPDGDATDLDATAPGDTTADTGSPDTPGDATDATDPDAADTDVVVNPDDPFAAIRIDGLLDVARCNRWNDGDTVAGELARKVRFTIAEGPANLGETALGGLLRLDLATGALAAQHRHAVEAMGSVETYDVTDQGDGWRLDALVTWSLGDAGELAFAVYATRDASAAPLDLVDGYEAYLSWTAPDGTTTNTWPCAGTGDLEDAVEVVVAEDGADALTALRWSRTISADAGSAPVALQVHEIRFSDSPWLGHAFRGHWAQTYVAAHHNFDDRTVLDGTGNLAHYQQWLGHAPDFAGSTSPVLREVSFGGLNTFGAAPELATVHEVPADGTATSRTWTATDTRWQRVDATHLRRVWSGECASDALAVNHVGTDTARFQLVTCTDATAPAGFDLRAVVPVVFAEDMAVAAQPITAFTPVTVDGRPGWTMAVGSAEVELSWDASGQRWFVYVRDGGGNVLVGALAEPQAAIPQPYTNVEALRFRSEDGAIELALDRRWLAQGVGESAIYGIQEAIVDEGGTRYRIDGWDQLTYTNTHHNWNDVLVADAGDRTFVWTVSGIGQSWTLEVRDAQGATVATHTLVATP